MFISSIVPITTNSCWTGAVQKTMQDFVRESELMADLRHPNIVCLIGVCMQEEPKVRSKLGFYGWNNSFHNFHIFFCRNFGL
jgi:hypothetical protein